MAALARNNVHVQGTAGRAMVFGHGFGCDQNMWRYVAPAFENEFRTVLYDNMGAGGSDLADYDPAKYSALGGYADDLIDLCRELGLANVVFVGHSVSAMIGILASLKAPGLMGQLVLLGPSPRYIDDEGYVGGFTAAQIEELLEFLDNNPMAWSAAMAPVIMANPERPDLGEELTASFCRADPTIAKAFARTTFTSDNRADLPKVNAKTLILQCSEDVIAPQTVGEYMHAAIPGSQLTLLQATGHCPHLSAPAEVISAIRTFV